MESLDWYLRTALADGGSDVHLVGGCRAMYRRYGTMKPFADGGGVLSPAGLEMLIGSFVDLKDRVELRTDGQIDTSYAIGGLGRFRVNIYRQKGCLGGVFRLLPDKVPRFQTLGLPDTLGTLTSKRRGLVLITGTTGSGKSTTLAGVVDGVNRGYARTVVTLEDPIEYVHDSIEGIVVQREVGSDVVSFAAGLRAALREDPDVIVVGEMRDAETLMTSLTAAETGHYVLSTLHTMTAVKTIDRVRGLAGGAGLDSASVVSQFNEVIDTIVSQQLLPRADGNGFVLACEVLMVNDLVRGMLRSGDTEGLVQYISSREGMLCGCQGMDADLMRLYDKGLVTGDVVLSYAVSRDYVSRELQRRGVT